MKKKLIFIILLLITLTPLKIFASSCSSTNISGQASSYATTNSDSGCTWVCWWNSTIGLRFRLYEYDGKNYSPLGNGIDVWGFDDASYVYMSNARYSNPDNNTISSKNSSSCATTQTTGKMNLTSNSYDDHPIYLDYSLNTAFSNGTVNNFILNTTKTGGWLYTNLYNKLNQQTAAADQEVKNLWGIEASEIRSKSSNVYVVVEVLVKVYAKQSNISGFSSGNFYFGTVSEFAPTLGYSSTYRALGIANAPVGKMVNGLINRVDISRVNSYFEAYGDGVSINKSAACNNAYGMAIYHLATDCNTCVKSCSTTCSEFADGTPERTACAVAYCKTNEPSNKSCVKSCSATDSDTGCEDKYNNKCDTYQKNGKTTKKSITGENCNNYTDSTVKELSTKVCYDDKNAYTIVDSNNSSSSIGKRNDDISYYKIECTENLVLSDLPRKTTAYLNNSKIPSLYTGYKMDYSKTCQLYYKKAKEKNSWIKQYSGSKLEADINTYLDIINGNRYTKTMTADEKKAFKEAAQAAYNEIKNVKANAETRLKNVSSKDYKTGTSFINQVKLEVINESVSGTTTKTVTLEPVSCIGISNHDEKKCTLDKNSYYKYTSSDTVVCEDSSGNEKTATINGNTSSYYKTVYYALPSSYIAAASSVTGKVFHTKNECLTAVKNSNGYCNEFKNVWIFDPVSESVSIGIYNNTIGNEALKINMSGYGSCGQFSYNLTCDYDYGDPSQCSKCLQYEYGSTEFNTCYQKYCSCDGYCGSNVACRAKYCPTECDGCDTEITDGCDDDDVCEVKCDALTDIENKTTCQYNCCLDDCVVGDTQCSTRCCVNNCKAKLSAGIISTQKEFNECIKNCDCENGSCGGDYYYRTIDLDRPFPGGTGLTREPGANWYQKVDYITTNDSHSKYYDMTNGRTSDYEYRIELSAEDIKLIKNDNNLNTTYTDYKKSTKVMNSNNEKMYCSWVLHEYLANKNINLETGPNVSTGSGCGI